WADNNAEAARAVSDIDRRRQEYIEQVLVGAGIAPPLAATRAQLLYWTYLGAALSRGKLSGERLNRMVAELKRIGLDGLTGTRRSANHLFRSPRTYEAVFRENERPARLDRNGRRSRSAASPQWPGSSAA